jgi:hypothetical protein
MEFGTQCLYVACASGARSRPSQTPGMSSRAHERAVYEPGLNRAYVLEELGSQ